MKGNFKTLSKRFVLRETNLYATAGNNMREIVADDDALGVKAALDALHCPSHRGTKTMYMNCMQRFCGFKRERIDTYVRSCEACQRGKPLARMQAITPIIADSPWSHIQADMVDLRNYADTNDGYSWILHVLDLYSKFCFSFPLKSKSSEGIAEILKKLFLSEGAPNKLQTDNGREFSNVTLRGLCESLNIVFAHGRPRHPQSQGQVERLNQTIVRSISRALAGQTTRWIDVVEDVVFQYNTSWHRAINTTPMMVFRRRSGRNTVISEVLQEDSQLPDPVSDHAAIGEPEVFEDEEDRQPISIEHIYLISSSSEANELIAPAIPTVEVDLEDPTDFDQIEYKHSYIDAWVADADVHRFADTTFNPGDRVIIAKDFDNNPTTRKRKLDGRFEDGVYTITSRAGRDNFEVDCEGEKRMVAKNRLRKLNSREETEDKS